MLAKDAEATAVQLKPKKGLPIWLKVSDLSVEDEIFVLKWEPRPEFYKLLEVIEIKEINDGYKKLIRVRVNARTNPLKLNIYPSVKWYNAKRIDVEPYATEEIQLEVFSDYRIEVINAAGDIIAKKN